MSSTPPEALPFRWKAAILSAAVLAFLCKITLALTTYGSNDMYAWERFAHWSHLFGSELYRIDKAFNHPPSMIRVLAALTWLAKETGIAFPFWLRLPAILADAAGLWVVYRIFAHRLSDRTVRWGLLLLALSPALILVSGFHGNTDPVVMLFVLLSVWFTQESQTPSPDRSGSQNTGEEAVPLRFTPTRGDLAAGIAFGIAMCVKIQPLIVLPVLFFCRRDLRRRAVFAGSAAAVILVCWSPYLFREPVAIFHKVIGYRSNYGNWGLSWIVSQLPFTQDEHHGVFRIFRFYEAYIVILIIAAASFAVNRWRPRMMTVYAQTGAAMFFFLAAGNGFGVQYLAWIVPWTVGLAIVPLTFFTVASGVFLLVAYNYWAGGFPWFLADSEYIGDFTPHLDYFAAFCWISVVVLAWAAWKRRPVFPSLRTRILLSAFAVLVFVIPAANQLLRVDKRVYPPSADHAALATIRAEEDATLSQNYYEMGRYTDAVAAARTGVALDPTVLDAWDNLALACIRLGRWDEARNAAINAVRIAPDDAIANASLSKLLSRR